MLAGVVELGVAVVGVSVGCGVLVVPVGVPDVSVDVPVVEPLPIDELDDGDDAADVVLSVVDGELGAVLPLTDELPVDDVDEGFDIELSVVGLSVFPHAPSAASVIATAASLIE